MSKKLVHPVKVRDSGCRLYTEAIRPNGVGQWRSLKTNQDVIFLEVKIKVNAKLRYLQIAFSNTPVKYI